VIEDEALRNMVIEILRQAVVEQKSGVSLFRTIVGDGRAALVGTVVTAAVLRDTAQIAAIGHTVAQSYTALVLYLEPVLSLLVNSWYGPGHNMQTVLNWIVMRARSGAKGR